MSIYLYPGVLSPKFLFPYILYIAGFLLLQNRHTVHPVHKLLAIIAMDGMYAGFAGAKACHKKLQALKALYIEAREIIYGT